MVRKCLIKLKQRQIEKKWYNKSNTYFQQVQEYQYAKMIEQNVRKKTCSSGIGEERMKAMENAHGILEQTKKSHKADIAKQFGKRYGAGYGTGAIGAVDSMFLEGPAAPGEFGRGKPKKF